MNKNKCISCKHTIDIKEGKHKTKVCKFTNQVILYLNACESYERFK